MKEGTQPERHAIVLAAGKGTRFNSERAKVLHRLCGKPMVCHVLDRLMELEVSRILVVVGYNSPSVQEALEGYPVEFVHQEQQLGTGHAVLTAMPHLADAGGSTLVLYGDSPLITTKTLGKLLHTREREEADDGFPVLSVLFPSSLSSSLGNSMEMMLSSSDFISSGPMGES